MRIGCLKNSCPLKDVTFYWNLNTVNLNCFVSSWFWRIGWKYEQCTTTTISTTDYGLILIRILCIRYIYLYATNASKKPKYTTWIVKLLSTKSVNRHEIKKNTLLKYLFSMKYLKDHLTCNLHQRLLIHVDEHTIIKHLQFTRSFYCKSGVKQDSVQH